MTIITALGNEAINKKFKENTELNIIGNDIQYQEAVIEILENNKEIDLLILSSILPGELNIHEFINIIKYKNPEIEIIIILEKEDDKLKEFIISKGINNIYYNNKITFEEIIKKLYEIENKNNINNKINELEKIILKNNKKKYLKIIKNKINYFINKLNKNKIIKNNKKIIAIIGGRKTGKTIFSLIISLNIKNKKILLIDFNSDENNMKIIIGKKLKNEKITKNNLIKWKNNVDILFIKKNIDKKNDINNLDKLYKKYDYIIIDLGNINESVEIFKKTDKIIMLVEPNLLGLSESKEILEVVVHKQKNQKDNVKIVFNKQSITSISPSILNIIFSDFEILESIQYDKNYDLFINSNGNLITNKIKNKYLKIIKKI